MNSSLSSKTSVRVPQILANLNESPIFGEHQIALLCDPDFCARQFHCRQGVAVLKEIPLNASTDEVKAICYDSTSKARFYCTPIMMRERRFLITNYWYKVDKPNVKDNLSYFEAWAFAYLQD